MESWKLRTGTKIIMNWDPFVVVNYALRPSSRWSAKMVTKLKNLLTWASIDKTFQSGVNLEDADVQMWKAQFLYNTWNEYVFMDNETFDQFEFATEKLWKQAKFLVDWMDVSIMKWNWNAINIELPATITVEIIEADPWVKGDTASSPSKNATIESWAVIQVPLFIKVWEKVTVNTHNWEYTGRVK